MEGGDEREKPIYSLYHKSLLVSFNGKEGIYGREWNRFNEINVRNARHIILLSAPTYPSILAKAARN